MKQKDIFLLSEGNAWLERNREKLGQSDPVSELIEEAGLRPMSVLEVGCANGWRLDKLRDKYGCAIMGVEPSLRGCLDAAELKIPVVHGTASMLPFAPAKFDLIIFGFCLYLTDPSDWLRIAAEADSILKEYGHIIIHDFPPPLGIFGRWYEHRDNIVSHHLDWSKLWLGHPGYHIARRDICDEEEAVTMLHKSFSMEMRP